MTQVSRSGHRGACTRCSECSCTGCARFRVQISAGEPRQKGTLHGINVFEAIMPAPKVSAITRAIAPPYFSMGPYL